MANGTETKRATAVKMSMSLDSYKMRFSLSSKKLMEELINLNNEKIVYNYTQLNIKF